RFYFYDSCLERRTVDSCGNSKCLKTPQSGLLEEAEAVPAESNGLQRKTITYFAEFIDFVSKQQYFGGTIKRSPRPSSNLCVINLKKSLITCRYKRLFNNYLVRNI